MLDLIIIGGGPIGIACALQAKEKGLNYLILEKGALVNSIYNYPLHMTFFSTAERLELNNIPFSCIAPKPGRQEAIEYYRKVTENAALNIHLYEKAEGMEILADGSFEVQSSKQNYHTKNIIIATGFYDIPCYLNVAGEALPKVHHYYKEAYPYAFQKVIVVGASNSSVDAALECWRKGADVTMIVRKSQIGERVKYWVKPDIENRIKEGSIKAIFESNIKEIKDKEVIVETPDGVLTIENDFVLALTGYQPNFEWLQKFGIQLSNDGLMKPQYNPETMESNIKGIYLAGVVCGGMETHKWFIENSRIHANMIIKTITNP